MGWLKEYRFLFSADERERADPSAIYRRIEPYLPLASASPSAVPLEGAEVAFPGELPVISRR